MAYDKVVDSAVLDANLTRIANAIRAKGGTFAYLAFPNGMVKAINAITTGGDLPTGVSALASGTVTFVQNKTYENITHNLGVAPNFIAWMLEDAATVTGLTSAAVCGASFDTGADSSNIRYMIDGFNSYGNGGGTASRATNETYMTTTTARMYAHNSYKLIAGKTYRWVCGVIEVV